MSSLRNAFRKRTYKERSQPDSRKKFGFLEKHKDYVIRAKEYHKKEETLRKLREKAANRNPDEFYFGMIRSKSVNGVHRPQSKGNKYKPKELSLTKTRDGYVLQKLQIEKKNVEKLRATLHDLGDQPSNRKKAKKLLKKSSLNKELNTLGPISKEIKREVNASYKELKARMKRVEDLERVHAEMTLQIELQKKGRKRKLREDEIVCPTSKPVYKWRAERKR